MDVIHIMTPMPEPRERSWKPGLSFNLVSRSGPGRSGAERGATGREVGGGGDGGGDGGLWSEGELGGLMVARMVDDDGGDDGLTDCCVRMKVSL